MRQFTLKLTNPCPCGSGLLLANCCAKTGRLHKEQFVYPLEAYPTGYVHQKCYMSSSRDCSTTISAEHFISRSVLVALGQRVAVDGVPWLNAGEQRILPINNLAANILCTRHNSILSPLDTEAGAFFGAIQRVQIDAQRRSLSYKTRHDLFSGQTIEHWMLKVAAGLFFSRNAAVSGNSIAGEYQFEVELLLGALTMNQWLPGAGMYIRARLGSQIDSGSQVRITPLIEVGRKRILGAGIALTGLEFAILLDPRWTPIPSAQDGWTHRPSEFHFHVQNRVNVIGLTWQPGVPPRSIAFHLMPTQKSAASDASRSAFGKRAGPKNPHPL
jgi:hypothetical protein